MEAREPLAVLIELVERVAACRGEDSYFSAVEVADWPTSLVQELRTLNLLAAASPATSLECPGCDQACVMPVHVLPGPTDGTGRAIIACDRREDIGRVVVPLVNLERLKSSGQQLAEGVVKLLGMTLARPAPIDGHAWRLGQFQGNKHKSDLTLLLDLVPRLAFAGHNIPMVEVLAFKKGAVVLDLPALRKLVDNPTGRQSEGQETAADKARRIRKRMAELKGKGVKNFLATVAKEEGVSPSAIKQLLAKHPQKAQNNEWHSSLGALASPVPEKGKRKH